MKHLIYLIGLLLCSCAQSELENIEPIEQPHMLRVANVFFVGTWNFELETCNTLNCQYAKPQIKISELPNNRLLIDQDTVLLTSPTTYVGAQWNNTLTSGTLANGILTHCELYADHQTQTSYYACVEYTR